MSSADSVFLSACLCSSFSFFALVLVAGFAYFWRRRNDIGGRRFASAADFVAEVSKRTGLEGSPREFRPFDSIYLSSFEGTRASSGRRARIWFDAPGDRRSTECHVHLAVASDPETTFAVRRRGVVARLLTAARVVEEVPTGDGRFDGQFSVEFAKGDGKAFPLSDGARAIVEKLFGDFPIDELAHEGGWVSVAAKEWKLDPASYAVVLALLDELPGTLGTPSS